MTELVLIHGDTHLSVPLTTERVMRDVVPVNDRRIFLAFGFFQSFLHYSA